MIELAKWNAQVLRFTLFPGDPAGGAGLWEKVVGEAPAVDEHRPRERIRRQVGPLGDVSLELKVSDLRLDWMIVPATSEGQTQSISAGSLDRSLEQFDGLLKPWLQVPLQFGVRRVAFGLVAVLPVIDRLAAYDQLQNLVPSVTFDAKNTREVLYRVNRPKTSRVLLRSELNRITTWNSISVRSSLFTISESGVELSGHSDDEHFVRCECDNSTSGETTPLLENSQLLPIYDELRDMAVENVQHGELP